MSVYALSTENLNREKAELDKLWEIYKKQFKHILNSKEIKENGMRVNIIGNAAAWRPDVRQAARDVMVATRNYGKSMLNILLAYGSQFEIMNSVKSVVKRGAKKLPLVPELFNKFLLVSKPVDLVIRTGGEHRLSNFLLYQAAYAEIYFSDTLWPAFSKAEFEKILKWYKNREKRFGK